MSKGMIRTQKKVKRTSQIIFFDVQVAANNHGISISLISNSFSENTCTFIADGLSEEIFLETMHDILRIPPPDNPMKLSDNDYAMAAGF